MLSDSVVGRRGSRLYDRLFHMPPP